VLAQLEGSGSVNHIWITVAPERHDGPDTRERDFLRRLVLRVS